MAAEKKLWNRKERKELARRLQSADPGLEIVHPHAAGLGRYPKSTQGALTRFDPAHETHFRCSSVSERSSPSRAASLGAFGALLTAPGRSERRRCS
jgi:hypothetical protein